MSRIFNVVWLFPIVLLLMAGAYGYIMNIVDAAHVLLQPGALVITGKLVLRIIGVFVAPLGIVMGFF